MSTKSLVIKRIFRSIGDREESLEFQLGLNVLTGRPNTGKSVWLNMLDYLLGDSGSPESAFGADLARKYDSIGAMVQIDGQEILLERNWKKWGSKTKVFVDTKPLNTDEFSDFLLSRLEIPNLHYPKGSPYKGTWPRLGWRSLFRHIYRQQRFWGDFADKQPESEQHACILLFLGIAEYVYSDKYGDLVNKRKNVNRLEAARDEFQKLLDRIAKELLDENELGVGVTAQSIGYAVRRFQDEIADKQLARQAILDDLLGQVSHESTQHTQTQLTHLGEHWANLQTERETLLLELNRLSERMVEFKRYQESLKTELERISRVDKAGQLLTSLKITHCPACDQPVEMTTSEQQNCFLCHQQLPVSTLGTSQTERLNIEAKHLDAELEEVEHLIAELHIIQQNALERKRRIEEQINSADSQLASVRQATSSIVSSDLAIIDMEIGRLQERMRQLERVSSVLDIRMQLAQEIASLEKEIGELENEVRHLMSFVDYLGASDSMADGMTTYLNDLNISGRLSWNSPGRIRWKITEQSFDVKIGDNIWSTKLGGTLTLYFLIAYHFALLNLMDKVGCHYPGLVILDLPPKLDDETVTSDEENFILTPFVQLLQNEVFADSQIIVAGSSFEGLESAHRVKLEHVWT